MKTNSADFYLGKWLKGNIPQLCSNVENSRKSISTYFLLHTKNQFTYGTATVLVIIANIEIESLFLNLFKLK